MDKRTRSLNVGHFFSNIKRHYVIKAKEDEKKEAQHHKGYYRSMFYISPGDFYRHTSGTFLKKLRKQKKINNKRRFA